MVKFGVVKQTSAYEFICNLQQCKKINKRKHTKVNKITTWNLQNAQNSETERRKRSEIERPSGHSVVSNYFEIEQGKSYNIELRNK